MTQDIINKYKHEFNWEFYVSYYSDLSHIKNEYVAWEHFEQYGFFEKRYYNEKLVNTGKQPIEQMSVIEETTINVPYHISKYLNKNLNEQPKYDYFNEHDILFTKMILKNNNNFLKHKIDIGILNTITNFILIIDFNNGGGGTTFFLNTIISKYKNVNTFLILRFDGTKYSLNINEEYLLNEEYYNFIEILKVLKIYKYKITKIFVNHFLSFDSNFIKQILEFDVLKISITHDYYNILKNPQPTFKTIKNDKLNIDIDINKFDILITQNEMNLNFFSKYYKRPIYIVELPDYFKTFNKVETQITSSIKCCVLGNLTSIKGKDKLIKLINHCKLNNENIEFIVFGMSNDPSIKSYHYNNIGELNDLFKTHEPNIILELSIWPETYSYTLTISMLTDLPILYYAKPHTSVLQNRLKSYIKSNKITTIDSAVNLIKNKFQNYFYTIEPILRYNTFWNDVFIDNTEKIILTNQPKFKYDVKPYFIYFPQYHEIFENNSNFYNKYNDIKNLTHYNQTNIIQKEIPNENYCNIKEYNYVLNETLIQKQIDLINNYGFSGVAMYYYWFSKNTFTNKNMIMDEVINKFFEPTIDMYDKKIFFIWANEDWTNNISLSPLSPSSNKHIINVYNSETFKQNSNNLIKFFKNKNYLKIDNKPVFFIYHNFFIENIYEFYNILNDTCLENGFNGVHLILNSFDNTNDNTFKQFYINFNYKKYDSRFCDKQHNNEIKLDYFNYMNNPYHCKQNKIQTIVFDFNNKPRLCLPNQLHKSTTCIDNSEINKTIFSKKLLETYKNTNYTELDKILLINAFNEWGENMTFEPSDNYGYHNINLLNKILSGY